MRIEIDRFCSLLIIVTFHWQRDPAVRLNPCGKRRYHSNIDKSGKAKYQALTLGIFCKDHEHPYHRPVGGRDTGSGYPCKKYQDVNNGQGKI